MRRSAPTRSALVGACLLCVCGPSPAGGKPLVGILAVKVPESQAAALEVALPRAPALASRWLVIGPAELSARLARQPAVSAAVDAARAHQLRAEQALAQMERKTAQAAAAAAIAALERVAGRHHVPADLVRAHLALARARLLHPADERGALASLQAALAVDPTLQLDLTQISPRVVGLLKQARRRPVTAREPSRRELTILAHHGETPYLVWIRARPEGAPGAAPGGASEGGDRLTVTVLVYARDGRAVQQQTRTLAADALAGQLPALVARTLSPLVAAPATRAIREPPRPRTQERGPTAHRPWYRRWWVWAAVGTAVAAAGVGIGLAASEASSGYDVVVRF